MSRQCSNCNHNGHNSQIYTNHGVVDLEKEFSHHTWSSSNFSGIHVSSFNNQGSPGDLLAHDSDGLTVLIAMLMRISFLGIFHLAVKERNFKDLPFFCL